MRINKVLEKRDICSDIRYFGGLLLPSFSNLLFLPIISILFSNFACSRSTGDNFTDSFLDRDCSERCWTGRHLSYTIIAVILLVIYIPVAIVMRPVWQELHPNLHVKAMPLNLIVKSVFQVFLVGIAVSLKQYHQKMHAICYLVTTSVYLVFIFRVKPYNYER
jgi:hypothetical protein